MEAPEAMETTTLDSNTITLMVMIAGSWLTLVGLFIYQFNRLDAKFDTKIDALDAKFDTKIDALDNKFDTKVDALDNKFEKRFDALGRDVGEVRERLARVEGHLMGPESFRPVPHSPPQAEPPDDERQAG